MFPNYTFVTQGSWETTNLLNMGQPVEARAIFIDLESSNAAAGEDGGVDEGVIIREARLVFPQPGKQDEIEALASQGNFDAAYALCFDQPIFPGSIEFTNGSGGSFRIELEDPTNNVLNMRFFLEGIEITDDICKVGVEIDSISNNVIAWLSYVDNRDAFGFNVDNYTLL